MSRRATTIALLAAVALVGVAAIAVTRVGSRAGVEAIAIRSYLLGRDLHVQVWTPADAAATTGPRPVVYLLPGRGGNEATWFGGQLGIELIDGIGVDRVAADLIAQGRLPAVTLVSIDLDDSYGIDSPASDDGSDHGPYETVLLTELIPAVERLPALAGTIADRYLMGISMGGFAALHAALRHPDRIAGVAALSPALFMEPPDDRRWLFPTEDARDAHDPLRLAATAPIDGLHIALARGDADYAWIIESTDALGSALGARGIRTPVTIVPGGHDRGTWRTLAPTMLEALLTIEPAG